MNPFLSEAVKITKEIMEYSEDEGAGGVVPGAPFREYL